MGETEREDCQVPLDHREKRGIKGKWDPLAHRGWRGYQDHEVQVGNPGPRGAIGAKGSLGERGPIGGPGAPGNRGQVGHEGPAGRDGASGVRGKPGFPGEPGRPGPAGQAGYNGDPGRQGPQGDPGPPGPLSRGAVYVRWGRISCPSVQGTELVYSGRAAGSRGSIQGGGANILCMPDDPEHMKYANGTQGNYIYGVQYHISPSRPLYSVYQHNVPCALCYVARDTVIKIPAKIHCPTNWNVEYIGYLMGEHYNNQRSTYECVDKDPDSVLGQDADSSNSAYFNHIEPDCTGISCGPYSAEKELTCVVCSR